jgi:hypothetical protein
MSNLKNVIDNKKIDENTFQMDLGEDAVCPTSKEEES